MKSHTSPTATPSKQDAWLHVQRPIARAREVLDEAQGVEDFQTIGILCRESLISLAQAVYVPERHPPIDETTPSKTDAKRMLEAYISAEMPGETNRYVRAVATSALNLAVDLQHSRNANQTTAALAIEQTSSVVTIISIAANQSKSRATVAQLCNRWVDGKPKLTLSSRYMLRNIGDSELGVVAASNLQKHHIINYCNTLKSRTKMKPQTLYKYLSYLRLVLNTAKEEWKLAVSINAVNEVFQELFSEGAIKRSARRTHAIDPADIERLRKFLHERETIPGIYGIRATLPVAEISEFSLWSGRRLGEICGLLWADVDMEKRTCIVRGLLAPNTSETWDHTFPLLGKAWEIVKARHDAGPTSDRIFPYRHESVGYAYRISAKKLGLTNLQFQDLRRLTPTTLRAAGHDYPEVFAVLGRVDNRHVMRELGLTQKPEFESRSRRRRAMLAAS